MHGQPLPKDELERLYYAQQLSMQQVAHHFGCSVNKVCYWMQQYGLPRRTWSEATYAYRNPAGDPFAIRLPTTPEEWKLFGVGVGLYMGEGTKAGFDVAIANTNPAIHRTFILFLERFCGIQKHQLKAWLNIFDDCDVDAAIQWWCNELGLEPGQFFKPYVRAARGGTYSRKSLHGTLTINFANYKLLKIINGWCDELV